MEGWSEEDEKLRFQTELEFVQSLGNVKYLQHLAVNGYMSDPHFLAYLDYLQYWTRPPYLTHIAYPHALFFLQHLRNPEFRAGLFNPAYVESVHRQQFYGWVKGAASKALDQQHAHTAAADTTMSATTSTVTPMETTTTTTTATTATTTSAPAAPAAVAPAPAPALAPAAPAVPTPMSTEPLP